MSIKVSVRISNIYFEDVEKNEGRLLELFEIFDGRFSNDGTSLEFNIENEDLNFLENYLYDNGDILDYEHMDIEVC